MSANPELERMLESLARELSWQEEKWFNNETGEPHIGMVLAVLKARLLPLLHAGQECRNQIFGAQLNDRERNLGCTDSREKWDAALRAALDAKP